MSTKLRGISALVRRGQWQTALVALICASLLMSIASLYSLHRFANNANEQVARLLAFAGEPAAVFKDEDAMRDVVLQIASREQLAEVNVLDRDGRLWVRHVKEASGLLDSMARATDRLFLPEPARAALESNGMRIGEVVLRSDGHFLMRYFGLVLLALGACVVITAVAVVAVSRRLSTAIVDPVRDLATLTRVVRTSRSFQLRAGNTSVIEFNDLADDFNNLLSELQAQQVKIAARHTDLQNANDSLRHTSRHDGLTQLPNRAYLVEHLNAVISRCLQDDTRAAALFVDVDKFKAVNDQHGHEAGDELLRELARRLLASVRASDFVARLGGTNSLSSSPRSAMRTRLAGAWSAFGEPLLLA